jgi:anti-sigma factor RsiW
VSPDSTGSGGRRRPHADLDRYVRGELDQKGAAAFERHLLRCKSCQAEVARLRNEAAAARRQPQRGRYGRGDYPEALHTRLPAGVKDQLAQLGRRFGRDLSDEVRVALYGHLRRNGMEVPEAETEAPRSHEEVLRDLRRLTEAAQELIDERGEGPTRDQAAG